MGNTESFDSTVEKLVAEMDYEFSRSGSPANFPEFPDIPTARYTSDEFYALEKEHLWNKAWVIAGREEDVAEVGSFLTFDELGIPLILVRGSDNKIRCFSNTCQHRGAPIVREQRGVSRFLRCQYHAWTYANDDGRLIAVTDERDFVNICKDEKGLPQMRCETWGGWIWVNLDPQAQPLDKFLNPIPSELNQFNSQDLRLIGSDHRVVNCNWKAVADAFLEVYHLRFIHKDGNLPELDNRGATMGLLPNGNSRMVTPFSESSAKAFEMEDWKDFKTFDNASGPKVIPNLHPIMHSTRYAFTIFPNTVIPLGASGFPILLFFPIDVSNTHLRIFHYALPDEEDGAEEKWEKRISAFAKIIDEDIENLAPIQNSMESQFYKGLPLSYQERRIYYLHETIDRTIGIDHIPENLRVSQLLSPFIESV